ncbi:MAG: hypothetical protein H6744_03305 [Deltaproteobacteria bacterium]|nr:hypothetical protein [Deltaproteobacteria bacterium]MCB9785703.1 hypothetical protein [Deltaproteobacteria bacterium]
MARADDDAPPDRDDAIFGAPDTPDTAPPATPRDRDAAIFGDDDPSPVTPAPEKSLAARVAAAADKLAIGGRLYLRLDWYTSEEGEPGNFPLASPNLLDLYLDARPNDRIRAYVQGRLRYDYTVRNDEAATTDGGTAPATSLVGTRDGLETSLDQLWLKFDIAHRVFVTLGRQPIRWGTGRFWNPTDFLNTSFRDPLAVFDERLGVSLLKVHIPIESLGWNLYAIADLSGADRPERIGGALRAEMLLGPAELALSFADRKAEPTRLGVSISFPLGLFDINGELAALHGVRSLRYKGKLTLDPDNLELPTSEKQDDEWLFRATLGAEVGIGYGDNDAVYFGAEYFFNELGYDSENLYPWLALEGEFTPLYLGRHYLGVYALLTAPGRLEDMTFIASAITNLSDRSGLLRFDYRVRLLTHLDFNAYASWHYGRPGEFHYSLEVPAVPGVDGLENGVRVSPPLIDVGVGFIVSI